MVDRSALHFPMCRKLPMIRLDKFQRLRKTIWLAKKYECLCTIMDQNRRENRPESIGVFSQVVTGEKTAEN